MLNAKSRAAMLCSALLLLFPVYATQSVAAGRSFEECQQLAIARGVATRATTKPMTKYERYHAAGTDYHPKGLIARCMTGRD